METLLASYSLRLQVRKVVDKRRDTRQLKIHSKPCCSMSRPRKTTLQIKHRAVTRATDVTNDGGSGRCSPAVSTMHTQET